jgi:hypothetical protein
MLLLLLRFSPFLRAFSLSLELMPLAFKLRKSNQSYNQGAFSK